MAKNYASNVNPRPRISSWNPVVKSTSISIKTRKDQKLNDAGGYVFKTSDLNYLRRFLVLGTEDGTYYVSGKKLTKDFAKFVTSFLSKDYAKVIDYVVQASEEGIAKQDTAIFVMAVAATHKDVNVRTYALHRLDKVCRIGTHLFTFATYIRDLKETSGWGRALKNAFSHWYNDKDAKSVAYQICKYASRSVEGELPWSHRDILRKAHIVPSTKEHEMAFRYAVKGDDAFDKATWRKVDESDALRYMSGHQQMKCLLSNYGENLHVATDLIQKYGLARESVPSEILNNREVYEALFDNMPLMATIRNLNKMTELGVLAPLGKRTKEAVERIADKDALKKARIHPLQLLAAMRTYGAGRGFKGSLTWTPIPAINKALEQAFYNSFNYLEPIGQRILLGIDMSGSMGGTVNGVPFLTTSEAAACMAMVVVRCEPQYHIIGFDTQAYDNLNINATDSLESVMKKIAPRGGTDCGVPIKWAKNKNVDVDMFVILTDNESYLGEHPYSVFNNYKKARKLGDSKLAIVSMTATNSSIADPKDSNMLDVVGFDTEIPAILSQFGRGW